MICIPIVAKTTTAMAEEMRTAAKLADLVELRMDYAPGADLDALLRNRPCPLIITNRRPREGGMFEGTEEARIALLQRAVELGADYVDVELDSIGHIGRSGRTRIIVSYHNFDEVPADLGRVHEELVNTGADIAKFACVARDIRDNLRVFNILRNAAHPTIALCMGELGLISRILGRKFGNVLTFASLETGKESAPGQISAADLAGLYRYKSTGPATGIYGVIANPVAHSMSPAIHNAAFEEIGFDGVYVPFKVEGNAAEFVRAFRDIDVQGYSVTIPHKQGVIPAVDDLDRIVRETGALNTIANRDGRLFGTNTDITGAIRALEEAMADELPRRTQKSENGSPLEGKRVLLLGAGGAARALAFGLAMRGAKITIANRTYERGVKLSQEVGCDCRRLEEAASCEPDILINTTSVGMSPNVDATPVPPEALREGMIVFDAVYNPAETRLLKDAGAAGCRTVSGTAWFVNQAAEQFELWTGRPAPRAVMERVIRERLSGGG